MNNTSKVKNKYVGLVGNVVNYTTIETNKSGKKYRKRRLSVKLQTMRFDVFGIYEFI